MHCLMIFMTCDPRPFNYIYLNAGSVHSIGPSKEYKNKALIVYGGGQSVVVDSTPEDVATRLGMIYEPHPEM